MDWVEIISALGFPIACVVALYAFVWVLYKASVAREERLMDVNEKAIATIAKYADRLDEIQKDVQVIKDDVAQIMTDKNINTK